MNNETTQRERPRSVDESLARVACALERLADAVEVVPALIEQEIGMAAAENEALDNALAGLNTELADVAAVDNELVADLVVLPELLGKINPTTPEQVNAVAAVTTQLQSLTAKVKAAAVPAEAAEQAAQGGAAAGGTGGQEPPPPAPEAPTQTVYTFDASQGATADDRFSPSGFETKGAAVQLLIFSGDSAPTDTNGSSVPGYSVFTGETEPVPAA